MVRAQVVHSWLSVKMDLFCVEGRIESGSLTCSKCWHPIVPPSWFVHVLRGCAVRDDYHLFCLPRNLKRERARVALDGLNGPLPGGASAVRVRLSPPP